MLSGLPSLLQLRGCVYYSLRAVTGLLPQKAANSGGIAVRLAMFTASVPGNLQVHLTRKGSPCYLRERYDHSLLKQTPHLERSAMRSTNNTVSSAY